MALARAALAVQPLVDSLLALWTPANLPADLAKVVGPYRELLASEGARFNLWWLVNNSLTWLRLVLPGLAEPAQLGDAAVRQVPTLSLILWAPLLLILGLGAGRRFSNRCRIAAARRPAVTGDSRG